MWLATCNLQIATIQPSSHRIHTVNSFCFPLLSKLRVWITKTKLFIFVRICSDGSQIIFSLQYTSNSMWLFNWFRILSISSLSTNEWCILAWDSLHFFANWNEILVELIRTILSYFRFVCDCFSLVSYRKRHYEIWK